MIKILTFDRKSSIFWISIRSF